MPLVRVGRDKIAGLITGAETRKYDSTGAVLWMASSTALHDPASTWLGSAAQASTMEAGYPIRAGNVLQFRGVYSTAQLNIQVEQWGIHSATMSSSGDLLNIAPNQVLGTKTSAQQWQVTACCTITT